MGEDAPHTLPTNSSMRMRSVYLILGGALSGLAPAVLASFGAILSSVIGSYEVNTYALRY